MPPLPAVLAVFGVFVLELAGIARVLHPPALHVSSPHNRAMRAVPMLQIMSGCIASTSESQGVVIARDRAAHTAPVDPLASAYDTRVRAACDARRDRSQTHDGLACGALRGPWIGESRTRDRDLELIWITLRALRKVSRARVESYASFVAIDVRAM
jgi:hypothetical protein